MKKLLYVLMALFVIALFNGADAQWNPRNAANTGMYGINYPNYVGGVPFVFSILDTVPRPADSNYIGKGSYMINVSPIAGGVCRWAEFKIKRGAVSSLTGADTALLALQDSIKVLAQFGFYDGVHFLANSGAATDTVTLASAANETYTATFSSIDKCVRYSTATELAAPWQSAGGSRGVFKTNNQLDTIMAAIDTSTSTNFGVIWHKTAMPRPFNAVKIYLVHANATQTLASTSKTLKIHIIGIFYPGAPIPGMERQPVFPSGKKN